jgi:hypothetical protein
VVDALDAIGEGLRRGTLVPYLGPEVLLLEKPPPVPASGRDLAHALALRVGVPARIRANVWSSAQFIETRRHRLTLQRLMEAIFAPAVFPNAFHRWLASLYPPLIVDCWYDDAMALALVEAGAGWGQIQAVTRNGKYEDIWYRFLKPDNAEATAVEADAWATVLYKPHGAVHPNGEFLLSDSDYVEVLTEIDIQTPIPPPVIARRTPRGFVFFGCRFRDQMDRIFAKEIAKRSAGPAYAVLAGETSRGEQRFLEEQSIERIDMPLSEAVRLLAGR